MLRHTPAQLFLADLPSLLLLDCLLGMHGFLPARRCRARALKMTSPISPMIYLAARPWQVFFTSVDRIDLHSSITTGFAHRAIGRPISRRMRGRHGEVAATAAAFGVLQCGRRPGYLFHTISRKCAAIRRPYFLHRARYDISKIYNCAIDTHSATQYTRDGGLFAMPRTARGLAARAAAALMPDLRFSPF